MFLVGVSPQINNVGDIHRKLIMWVIYNSPGEWA